MLLLAPQLLAFAGSEANFESLASGLTLAQPIMLTTTGDSQGGHTSDRPSGFTSDRPAK